MVGALVEAREGSVHTLFAPHDRSLLNFLLPAIFNDLEVRDMALSVWPDDPDIHSQ